jgi:hypothetical protein
MGFILISQLKMCYREQIMILNDNQSTFWILDHSEVHVNLKGTLSP